MNIGTLAAAGYLTNRNNNIVGKKPDRLCDNCKYRGIVLCKKAESIMRGIRPIDCDEWEPDK